MQDYDVALKLLFQGSATLTGTAIVGQTSRSARVLQDPLFVQ